MTRLRGAVGKDYCAAMLLFAVGLGAMSQGASYEVGTLTNMGPGFFPVALGTLLSLLGIAMMLGTRLSGTRRAPQVAPRPEWFAWGCIVVSIAAFVVIGRYGGLVPATFAVVFISALGDRRNSWKTALVLAASMDVLAVAVFWWALKLQFPLFSWG